MQQAVDYLLKVRPQLSCILASYALACRSLGTLDDSNRLRYRVVQQRGGVMAGLTKAPANFLVILRAKPTEQIVAVLPQLCCFYMALLDNAVGSLQRTQNLHAGFKELTSVPGCVFGGRRGYDKSSHFSCGLKHNLPRKLDIVTL